METQKLFKILSKLYNISGQCDYKSHHVRGLVGFHLNTLNQVWSFACILANANVCIMKKIIGKEKSLLKLKYLNKKCVCINIIRIISDILFFIRKRGNRRVSFHVTSIVSFEENS